MTAFTTRFRWSWAEFVGPGATRTNTTITLAAGAFGLAGSSWSARRAGAGTLATTALSVLETDLSGGAYVNNTRARALVRTTRPGDRAASAVRRAAPAPVRDRARRPQRGPPGPGDPVVGEPLRLPSVVFVVDYVQLCFDGDHPEDRPVFNCYVWPVIEMSSHTVADGEIGYADGYWSLIPRHVTGTSVGEQGDYGSNSATRPWYCARPWRKSWERRSHTFQASQTVAGRPGGPANPPSNIWCECSRPPVQRMLSR